MLIESHLFSDMPEIRHGFFTRKGGVSSDIYDSLNCGSGSYDRPENVAENRRRAARRIGIDEERLITINQVHSADVVTVNDPSMIMVKRPTADGMVTAIPGIALSVLTADCAPLLLADQKAKIIGAAHAGWKGIFAGIIENTISAMVSLGATRENISVCVGPCISQDSYQVGPDFPGPFIALDPHARAYFVPDAEPGKYQFDLRGLVLSRIFGSGVEAHDIIDLDTYKREDLFFSYRRACHRAENDYGRGLSAIMLEE
tara:strand:- start:1313 stop:2086 length:774 start_codon:yes stop_codon:yes gene_type:complete